MQNTSGKRGRNWKRLLREVGSYKKDALLSPVCTICCVILEILIPYLTASIIDDGIATGNLAHVIRIGGLMVLAALLAMFFGIRAGQHTARAATGFACNLREAMFSRIQEYSFSNIDHFSTAGLVTRMTTDVTSMQNALQMALTMFTRAPVTLAVALFMAISISPRLSVVFLGAMAFLAAALGILMPKAMKYFKQMFRKYDQVNAAVKENVGAIRVVKAYVREEYEENRFLKAVNELYGNSVSAERIISLNMPVMMMTVYSCILLISWFGAHMIVEKTRLTTGELTSLLSYVMNILISLMMLSMVFVMITQSAAAAERICEVLEEKPEIVSPEEPLYEVKNGDVDFDHVEFSYSAGGSGRPVLSDIEVHIRSGETIGIIGGTGSSKSSLVNLISRLYDASSGSVRVGGEDVRKYDLSVLRSRVAVVLQKNVLFSGTILENLRWGNPEASEEECREACRLACADEFIERMPNGYNTMIERGGTNVSGGQKQRLCIARALVGKPKVLILDDSTSAVDTATDAKIRQAMRQSIPGTTKIIIAQRISSVEDADRVLVMDEGRISAFDTPARLLETSAIYREVYESQKKNADFDEDAMKGGAGV